MIINIHIYAIYGSLLHFHHNKQYKKKKMKKLNLVAVNFHVLEYVNEAVERAYPTYLTDPV